MGLEVRSSAFAEGAEIPRKYTCDGQNISPPVAWGGVPPAAKSLAVICDDPDAPAGTFTHWVLYNISPANHGLPDHATGGTPGVNSFGRKGYGGPCPPKHDRAHHYHFHVYALDVESLGPAGLSKDDVLKAMRGHVLADGETIGTYQRAA